jgi:hypothetical protein
MLTRLASLLTILIALALADVARGQSTNQQVRKMLDGVRASRESLPPCTFELALSSEVKNRHGETKNAASSWSVTAMLDEWLFKERPTGETSLLRPHELITTRLGQDLNAYSIPWQSSAFVFDPKLLGLCRGPFSASTLQNELSVENIQSATRDSVIMDDGVRNQRIVVTNAEGHELTFWIDLENDFRVLKYERYSPNISREVVVSLYSNDFAKGILPYKVIATGENQIDGRIHKLDYLLSNFNIISNQPLSLLDMDLPVGVAYRDVRMLKRIGYWDGEKLVPEIPRTRENKRPVAPENRNEAKTTEVALHFGLVVCAVVLGIAFFFMRGKRLR